MYARSRTRERNSDALIKQYEYLIRQYEYQIFHSASRIFKQHYYI